MTYTDIKELNGLDLPIDYGSGIEFANGLVDSVFAGQNIGLQVCKRIHEWPKQKLQSNQKP